MRPELPAAEGALSPAAGPLDPCAVFEDGKLIGIVDLHQIPVVPGKPSDPALSMPQTFFGWPVIRSAAVPEGQFINLPSRRQGKSLRAALLRFYRMLGKVPPGKGADFTADPNKGGAA